MTSLHSNDFELFDLPQQFTQDAGLIDARWRQLQRQAHPDKYAAQGAAAQRLALQWSVRINEAYQRLKDPIKRAAYLCELAGVPVLAENNTAMPKDFLQQQMHWREALDEAQDAGALDALAQQVRQAQQALLAHCAQWIDHTPDWAQAVAQVRALMFVQRFESDVQQQAARLATHGSL